MCWLTGLRAFIVNTFSIDNENNNGKWCVFRLVFVHYLFFRLCKLCICTFEFHNTMRKTTWIIFGVFSSTSDFDDHFEGPQKCNAVLNLIISEKNHLRTWLYFQYEQCTIVLTILSFGQCESTWSIVFNNKKHPHIWINVSLVMSTTDGKKCGCVFFFVWWMCVLDSFRNSYTFYRSNTKTPNIVREKIHKKKRTWRNRRNSACFVFCLQIYKCISKPCTHRCESGRKNNGQNSLLAQLWNVSYVAHCLSYWVRLLTVRHVHWRKLCFSGFENWPHMEPK